MTGTSSSAECDHDWVFHKEEWVYDPNHGGKLVRGFTIVEFYCKRCLKFTSREKESVEDVA